MPKRRVYLDFAAATPLTPRARRAYVGALDTFGNASAPHKEGREARAALENARVLIARTLSVKPEELVFTSGGTESNNIAILGGRWRHAVTSTIEHSSTAKAFRMLEKSGVRVTYVQPNKDGVIEPATVLKAVRKNTDFISLHHVQSELGTVQPLREIGLALKKLKQKIVFHVDAAQSPLWLDASSHTFGAHLVSYDAQKAQGPKGVGVLWRDFSVPLLSVYGGGTQERGMRPGTENVPAAVSAAVAFTDASLGRKTRVEKVAKLRDYLAAKITKEIPSALILGSMKRRVANNLFLAIPGVDGDYLAVLMDNEGIAVTPRSACLGSGGAISDAAFTVTGDKKLAKGTIRFSLSPTTTKSDLDYAIRAFKKVLTVHLNLV